MDRPPAGKTQKKWKFFPKNVEKRLFPKFYLDSKLKVENPKMPLAMGKKKCWVCRGFRCHFRHFSMLHRHSPIFDKKPNLSVFGTFFLRFFAFFALFANLWHFRKKMSENVDFPNSRRYPAAQSVFLKHVFGTNSQFPEITKVSWVSEFQNFGISRVLRSEKHLFFIHL
jgi:hypothetical protein